MKIVTPSNAQYAGAISRWCDLHRKSPVVLGNTSKAVTEFEAFNAYLDSLATERRANPGLTRPPIKPSRKASLT